MTPHLEPDVAFGVHPDLSMAAAVSDDRPYLDEVLRKHHFRHSSTLDVYLLPDGTPHNAAVRSVARASLEFQEAGLSVAVDPRIVLPPPVPTPDGEAVLSDTHTARSRAALAASPNQPTTGNLPAAREPAAPFKPAVPNAGYSR
ncbi:hypothetical protein [Streptomyces sp. Ru87]|uniref:hypothetical protein n=1 Tax=Streptomyces sp. Ru87 TaxID=2044307 RepID=UPI000BF6993B|nr:hypothetical protein [Streptomyces sp. Ru87]PGH49682.1 hypothetical protein CRI70_16105 [Streptomyces sp. Ru87]